MKKVIFLVLVLKSFLSAYTLFNFNGSNVYCNSKFNESASVLGFSVPNDSIPHYLGVYQGFDVFANGGTVDVLYNCNFGCASGTVFNKTYMKCVPTSCPVGQIMNEETFQCECSPRPTGYNIDVPLTEENCNITQASLLLAGSDGNGQTRYITAVQWESCRGVCMGTTAECPCNTALLNGACVDVSLPDGQCPDGSIFKNTSIGVSTGEGCRKTYYSLSSGFECWSAPAGCCTGNSGTNDGDGDGQPDTNTTNPDTNTTNPGDPGEDGGGDSNTSTPALGDSNTSTPGDSNTSTPGDSNTSTPGDSNTTSAGQYEDSDADKEGKGKIGEALNDAYDTLDKMKQDYERMMTRLESGVTPISLSFGSAPIFCANVFGKQICINLCDSFGYFYSILYYIFLALFTVMALRIYYTAFKMR